MVKKEKEEKTKAPRSDIIKQKHIRKTKASNLGLKHRLNLLKKYNASPNGVYVVCFVNIITKISLIRAL